MSLLFKTPQGGNNLTINTTYMLAITLPPPAGKHSKLFYSLRILL